MIGGNCALAGGCGQNGGVEFLSNCHGCLSTIKGTAAKDNDWPPGFVEFSDGGIDLIGLRQSAPRQGARVPAITSGNLQHIEGDFKIGGSWPLACKMGEGAGQPVANILGGVGAHVKGGHRRRCRPLIDHLVEAAPTLRAVGHVQR